MESKWPSGDVSKGQKQWKKLRNALLAIQMLKKLGKDRNGEFKASLRAQQQQMQAQSEAQSKQDEESRSNQGENINQETKPDSDNISGSSLESCASRESSTNGDTRCPNIQTEDKGSSKPVPRIQEQDENINSENITAQHNKANLGSEKFSEDQLAKENINEVIISETLSTEIKEKSDVKTEVEGLNKDNKEIETNDASFRRRTSTIVKTSTTGLPGVEQAKSTNQPSSNEKDEFKRSMNFKHQPNEGAVTTTLNDLNLANLGQDKKIVDLMKAEEDGKQLKTKSAENSESPSLSNVDTNLSTNLSKHADQIRGKMSNLFGRHNPQGSGVNRVLFTSEDHSFVEPTIEQDDGKSDLRSFVSEESSEYSGYATRSSASKSRSQSVESDEGMVMLDTISCDTSPNKQIKPLPTLHETPDTIPQQNSQLLSPSSLGTSPMHKVASSSSMCVPVTVDDPLGALSAATSPTNSQAKSPSRLSNSSGLTKSFTCPSQSLSQAGHNESQSPEKHSPLATNANQNMGSRGTLDENILGSPFANQTNMTRSTTMPVKEQADVTATPSSRWRINTSKIASLKKSSNYLMSSLSPSTVTKAKTHDVLNKGLSQMQSAYANATTSLSKKVEEIKEYQEQQRNLQGPTLSYPGNFLLFAVSVFGSMSFMFRRITYNTYILF